MIYLDNAATSYPKPPQVQAVLKHFAKQPLGNPGRSTHGPAMAAAELLLNTRRALGTMFDTAEERVIFTLNTSHALNLGIFGLCLGLSANKNTVLTDEYQHNSVLRPLYALEREGKIRLRFCPPGDPEAALDDRVALGVFSAVSNVTGEAFHVRRIGSALHRAGALFLCDGAQGAGRCSLSMEADGMDLLCVPAHKGLMGVMGAGALLLSSRCPPLTPLLWGGTGSAGLSREMPDLLPDRLEVGTPPLLAVAAWEAGLSFVAQRGIETIAAHEDRLCALFRSTLSHEPGLQVYSPLDSGGILLVNRKGHSPHRLAAALDELGICVRSGFHCAPLAHKRLGTGEDGALRFSFGPFNTPAQAVAAAHTLMQV